MPIREFKCETGHITEKVYLSFAADDLAKKAGGGVECSTCGRFAERVEFSAPYPALLFGNPEGYHKPSALKRHSTKIINSTRGNND